MRERKFKVWDILNKRWFTCDEYCGIHINPLQDKYGNGFDLNDSIGTLEHRNIEWVEYTGRKDKNRKEVYEDSLLKDEQGNIGRVFYHPESCSYLINWHRKDGQWETDACFGYGIVVGSYQENPELLEGNET